jgi:hypothetical protein
MSDQDEFEALFSEIAGDEIKAEAPAVAVAAVAETEELPADIKAVVETPMVVETPKEKPKYQPDTGKVLVEGAPAETLIYSAGYCRFRWPNPRFANQAVLYADQVDELAKFFQSEEYTAWRASADKAGLRKRGEQRKES